MNAIDATGAHVVGTLARRLGAQGTHLVIAAVGGHDGRRRTLERECPRTVAEWFPDADRALKWCEERLLASLPREAAHEGEIELEQMDVCRYFDRAELELLRRSLVRETHPHGALLFREGEDGDCLYLLVKGAVSMLLRGAGSDETGTRLATFMPGVVFGELAVLEGRPRSADAVCEADCVVYVLSGAALRTLEAEHPALAIKLYKAVALTLAGRLRITTRELRLLVTE